MEKILNFLIGEGGEEGEGDTELKATHSLKS